MGVKFLDYNQDGRFDLYVTDMHSDMAETQTRACLATLQSEFEKSRSDAWCSVFWTDAFLQGASNNIFGNALYWNPGTEPFAEISQQIGVETYWPWGVSAGDLNADGYEDLFVREGMGFPFRYAINSVLLNEAGHRFVDAEFLVGVEPRAGGGEGGPRGVAVAVRTGADRTGWVDRKWDHDGARIGRVGSSIEADQRGADFSRRR